MFSISLLQYYVEHEGDDWSLICSSGRNSGQVSCTSKFVSKFENKCSLNFDSLLNSTNSTLADFINNPLIQSNLFSNNNATSCIDWNLLYTHCKASDSNPHHNVISFDSVSDAFIAIFQVSFSKSLAFIYLKSPFTDNRADTGPNLAF